MDYAVEVLKRFRKNLLNEISDVGFISSLYRDKEAGEITDEDLAEMRGYRKGLNMANEILQKALEGDE